VLNNSRPTDPRQQAELEARLRDLALRRAQERLVSGVHPSTAQAGVRQQRSQEPAPDAHQATPPQVASAPSLQVGISHTIQSAHGNSSQLPPQSPPRSLTAHQASLEQGGLDFIGGQRDVKDFLRADRHTGRVRFLRIALPLTAVFILSVVLGAYFWSQASLPSISIQSAGIENGKMVMRNPQINGVDEQQRPFSLVASEAITDPAVPSQVEFKQIDAQLPMEEGVFANILAGTGFYDSEAKTLKLGETVDIKTDDGMSMTLQDADVDIDSGSLLTANPVSILTEQARISADSFTVENNGETVIFERRVRMTIYPEKFEEAEDTATAGAAQ